MTTKEARDILDRVSCGEFHLGFTNHFWDRVNERLPGLIKSHVYDLLRRGRIVRAPKENQEYNNYTVKIRATLVDYGPVQVVVGISSNPSAVCITVYRFEEED